MIQLVYSAIVGVHRISNTYFNSPVIARDINTGRYTLPGAIDAVDTRGRLDTIYASIGELMEAFIVMRLLLPFLLLLLLWVPDKWLS